MFGFMSVVSLAELIQSSISKIPTDIDLVVGIPRSGMLPAYLIGLYRNTAVLDLPTFLKGDGPEHGSTRPTANGTPSLWSARSILLVDDSVSSGRSMKDAVDRILASGYCGKLKTCAAIVEPSKYQAVDIHFCEIPMPRFFEWNAFHHPYLIQTACMDMDGVLCEDPGPEQNDDGARYREFLRTTPIRFRPTGKIGHIVSARLEKYRSLTEEWLRRNKIEYGSLQLLDLPTGEDRSRLKSHSSFKARFYRASSAEIFFESNPSQAHEIARLSRKPVLCVETMRLHLPAMTSWSIRNQIKWKLAVPIGRARSFFQFAKRAVDS